MTCPSWNNYDTFNRETLRAASLAASSSTPFFNISFRTREKAQHLRLLSACASVMSALVLLLPLVANSSTFSWDLLGRRGSDLALGARAADLAFALTLGAARFAGAFFAAALAAGFSAGCLGFLPGFFSEWACLWQLHALLCPNLVELSPPASATCKQRNIPQDKLQTWPGKMQVISDQQTLCWKRCWWIQAAEGRKISQWASPPGAAGFGLASWGKKSKQTCTAKNRSHLNWTGEVKQTRPWEVSLGVVHCLVKAAFLRVCVKFDAYLCRT